MPCRVRVPLIAVTLIAVTLAPTGCGNTDGGARVRLAERQLAEKQEALAEARTELAARADAFCRTSASYVLALDRYGNLITGTAPTVGDVKEAGADLTEPRSDVLTAADQVATARADVTTAEQEVAEATAALASARGEAAPSPPVSVSVPAEPPIAETTVARLKQADADFTAAQQGITDQTPLRQASEQFNAAAVALEMSWLALLAEAGCLSEDQLRQARDYTLAVQKSLAEAGYYQAEVDGVYGPTTVAAVQAMQKANNLPETGTVDMATNAALQAELQAQGSQAADEAIATTAAVQQTLKLAGFWPHPVDGVWTPDLTEALKSFQTALGVKPTGTMDAATVAAVKEAAKRPPPAPSGS
ncbi:peptidoglycan-binding domain-containing protein [Paractinoplanes rishiriensis]|nr:peptidoglycan-binding domain-containing protein [Actinoplanes rishiriensis]